jgi:hypothetical protein
MNKPGSVKMPLSQYDEMVALISELQAERDKIWREVIDYATEAIRRNKEEGENLGVIFSDIGTFDVIDRVEVQYNEKEYIVMSIIKPKE